jgi:hypothetical protein
MFTASGTVAMICPIAISAAGSVLPGDAASQHKPPSTSSAPSWLLGRRSHATVPATTS